MQLRSIDLNLLVVLDAVLAEGTVQGAAHRLALSPSATSHALSRLRDLFDDPLLVRAGRTMVVTARGEALRAPVKDILQRTEGLFRPADVDPATLDQAFRVLTTDYVEMVLLGSLVARLATAAPGVDLHMARGRDGVTYALREGRSDLAVGVYQGLGSDLVRVPLFDEGFVCLVRSDHPVVATGLDLDAYVAMDHVLVAPGGGTTGVVDRLLAAVGRDRRVAITSPSFLAAPHLLPGTDNVLTIASRLAHRLAPALGLAVLAPPLDLPTFTVSLVWHERWTADPVHRWMREQLHAVADGFSAVSTSPAAQGPLRAADGPERSR